MTRYYHLIILFIPFLFTDCLEKQDRQRQTEISYTSDPDKDLLYEQFSSNTISLNGTWDVTEGTMQDIPSEFGHQVQVPGLITQASPSFENVGIPSKKREAFWYRTTFPLDHNAAPNVFLKIYKAKYGTAVYVNGEFAGDNMLNFTPARINITPYLNRQGNENELLIRVGAHIESLPDTVVTGGEVEKFKYIPGIYDFVELQLSEQIYFQSVQVATTGNEVNIEADIHNNGPSNTAIVNATIKNFATGTVAGSDQDKSYAFNQHETKTIQMSIPVENPAFWTPETPDLYLLELRAGDETYTTRFGFRNFRLDSLYTHAAYLNGKRYYFRGTNIALFRFFEDPLCEDQPWNRDWVRALFRKFKSMGMNSARTTICSFPKFWYEIADEEGFALFAEYPIWYALKEGVSHADFQKERLHPQRKYGIYPEKLTVQRLVNEYTHWMEDLWNHASVIAWDAQNETWTPATGEAINEVRDLDLSGRPWDNGWSPPASPDDYREGHQYFARYNVGSEDKSAIETVPEPFSLDDLSFKEKNPRTLYIPYQHAYDLPVDWYLNQPCILNEYGYLWLNRDGTPTTLTKPYYDAVLGPEATADERREHYAYMLAALTEYWRSVRTCFGVLHVFGLAHSHPQGATSDNFIDVNTLEFDEYFSHYVPDAFSPVGLCIETWFVNLIPGISADIPVVITNDTDRQLKGTVEVILRNEDSELQKESINYEVDALRQNRLWVRLYIPDKKGEHTITAATRTGDETVRSVRKIEL